MTSRGLRLVLSAACLLLSCGSPDLSAEISDYASAVNGSRTRLCDCPDLLGYASIAECKAGLGDVTAEAESCIADALEGDEDEGRDYLTCTVSALVEYSDCLASNVNCEESVLATCMQIFDEQAEACGNTMFHSSVQECL